MNIPMEEKKQEALARMKFLDLHKNIIKEFDKENIVNMSERAYLYWLTDEQKQYVSEFEEEYNALVYHVINY